MPYETKDAPQPLTPWNLEYNGTFIFRKLDNVTHYNRLTPTFKDTWDSGLGYFNYKIYAISALVGKSTLSMMNSTAPPFVEPQEINRKYVPRKPSSKS